MPDFVFRTKGLTAKDREQWEKDNISQLNSMGYNSLDEEHKQAAFKRAAFRNQFKDREDINNLLALPEEERDKMYFENIKSNLKDSIQIEDTNQQEYTEQAVSDAIQPTNFVSRFADLLSKDYLEEEGVTEDALIKLQQQNSLAEQYYNQGKQWHKTGQQMISNLESKATEVSPFYRKYIGTTYLPWDDDKKLYEAAKYKAWSDLYGEDYANQKLYNTTKRESANNQPTLDAYNNGFWGGVVTIGASTGYALGASLGFLVALTHGDRLTGNMQDSNFFKNLWLQTFDNPMTQYFDNVLKHKSFMPQNFNDELSDFEILTTPEEDANLGKALFSRKLLPQLIEQSGFTVGSMVQGVALSRMFNQLMYLQKVGALENIADKAQLIKRLEQISKAESYLQGKIVPGLSGTFEGLINALDTKKSTIEELTNQYMSVRMQDIEATVDQELQHVKVPEDIVKSGQTEQFLTNLRNSRINYYMTQYGPDSEDLQEIEDDANTAAFVNFMFNQCINGFLNTTWKAPMFGDRTTEALRRTRVGRLFASNKYKVRADDLIQANKIDYGKMAYNALKESVAEAGEEYTQDITDATAIGGAQSDFDNYLRHKYLGEADEGILDGLLENTAAAFVAGAKKAVSKDALKSGMYGLLGQMIGTPNIHKGLSSSNYKQAWQSGEGKSWYSKFYNRTTGIIGNIYRNPLIDSVYRDLQENKDREAGAKALNDWLNEGNNREKYFSIKGSIEWAKEMQEEADKGDEFEFRNKRLGKLVQDYFMLEQLKGTSLYDKYTEQMMDILNADEDSQIAQQIVKDSDITLEQAKADVQKRLDIMKKVQEAIEEVEKVLGESVSQDTKEHFVFGKLANEDIQERQEQIELELTGRTTPREAPKVYEDIYTYIARNGNLKFRENPKIDKLKKEIETAEKNKSILSKEKQKELEQNKKDLKELEKKESKRQEEYNKMLGERTNTEEVVLNEEQILNLDPISRAIMFNPKNIEKYSQAQQEIIKKILQEKNSQDVTFSNKIEDSARLYEKKNEFMDKYIAALSNPQILSIISRDLKYQRKKDILTKSYQFLNTLTTKSEFTKEFNKIWDEADDLGHRVLNDILKDNEFYKEINKANTDNNAYLIELQNNPKLQELSPIEQAYVAATIGYLTENGYSSQEIEAQQFLTQDEGLGLKQWIDNYNLKNPNEQILYDKVGDIVGAFQKATDILIEEQKELEKANTVDTKTPTTDNTKAAPVVTQEEAQQEQEKQQDQNDKKENTNKILESIYDRLKNNTVFSPLIDGFKDEIKQLFEQGKLSEESTVDDLVQVLSNTTYSSPENQAFGSEVVNQLKNPIAKEQQRKVEESKSEEKKAEGQQDSQQNEGGKAVINLLNYNDFNSETPKAIKDFYEAYEIDLYLRKNEITPNKQIHIAYLSDLSGKNQAVTLVALVEDENGPININGHKFQPIGVLPNSFEGVEQLNDKIDNKQKDSIIAHTTLNGRIQSSNSPMIDSSKPNISLKEVANIETYERLKKEVQQTEDADSRMRKASALANNVMQWIFSKIHVNANKTSKKGVTYTALEYKDTDLKGGEYVIDIFIAEPWESTNKEGKSLKEVLLGGNYDEISTFNSRLGTEKILGINFSSNIGFCNVLFEYYRSHQQGVNLVEDSEKLDKSLQKWIRLSSGYHYKIEKIEGTDNYQLKVEGPIINGKKTDFILAETNKSAITEELIAQAVKNLFLDQNGNFRTTMYNSKEQSIAKWNVDYSNFDSRKTDTYNSAAAQNDRANVFKDGLLTISYTRLSRQITQIPINNPINPQAKKTNTTITNQDNANMNPSPIIQDNSNNKPKPNQTENNTIEIVNRIIEDSKKVVRGLVNGTRQAIGVTRIIRGTNQTSNQRALTVGNIVDKLVRNILANKVASEYPNIDNEDRDKLVKQLEEFKRKELAGYEIISEINYPDGTVDGVRVNGEIIIKSNENEYKVPITGTLDLLAYNPVTGKFRIYDMKTIRDTRDLEGNKDSWKKQLYLYKKMLEDKYGITVESVHILPIKVNYNDNLEVQDNKLVFYNGQEYKGVEPQLLETVDIDLNNFNFRARLEYLTQEERDFIKGEIPSGEPEEIKVEDKPKPPVKSNSNLAAPSLQDSSAIDDLGLSSNDIQNGQDDMASSIYSNIDEFPDNTQNDLWKYLDTDGKYNSLEEFKEFWITLDQEEQEKALECVGFL